MTGRREHTVLCGRIAVRLLKRGQSLQNIADVFGVSRQAVFNWSGPRGARIQPRQRAMIGRIMRRLRAKPYRWRGRQIAEIWQMSPSRAYDFMNEV